jgi:NitT/TauT family transport system ATP-binding protein
MPAVAAVSAHPAPLVEVRIAALSKRFDEGANEVVAFENLDLEVYTDEFVVILGPSGCGKSTLLSILAGYEKPTSGEVLIGGRPVLRPGPSHFMVFQSPALFPWLTTLGNVTIGLKERGFKDTEIRERAAELLHAVGLSGFERRYPYQLSGGMQQRVQLARALIHGPDVLLMDEPFGALDFQTRAMMQQLLVRIWESYRHTVIFITHDVDEALHLGDRIVLMSQRPGRISAVIDSPFERPRDLESLALQPGYAEVKRDIMRQLRNEITQSRS